MVDDKKKAGFQLDGSRLMQHFVADAARLVREERLVVQGPAQAFCKDTGCLFPPGDKRNNICGPAMNLAKSAHEEGFFHAIIQTNITGQKSVITQQSQVAEGLVETASQRTNNENFTVPDFNGQVQSQFKESRSPTTTEGMSPSASA
jgi:hypothetical protein